MFPLQTLLRPVGKLTNLFRYSLLKELKKDEKTRKIPVIVVTANYSAELKEECRQLGASGFINKPFERDEFIEPIKKLVKPR